MLNMRGMHTCPGGALMATHSSLKMQSLSTGCLQYVLHPVGGVPYSEKLIPACWQVHGGHVELVLLVQWPCAGSLNGDSVLRLSE